MAERSVPERCPFQSALETLGRRHNLTILWLLQQRSPRRFTEFRRALGINPVTLTARLSELEHEGYLLRTAFSETPPRVEYGLRAKGRDLLPLLEGIERWAKRYDEIDPRVSAKVRRS